MDEASMIDVPLMNAITRAIQSRSGLLPVGNVDQLPSVGPGLVLADVIDSGAVLAARLTEVFRQAAESRIVANAHRINGARRPISPKSGEASDFFFLECKDPEDSLALAGPGLAVGELAVAGEARAKRRDEHGAHPIRARG
jgi:exodeoxyribonuclease V alpha subunit